MSGLLPNIDANVLSSSPGWSHPLKLRNSMIENEGETDEDDFENKLETDDYDDEESLVNLIREDDYSIEFFRPMFIADDKLREMALKRIISLLEASFQTPKKELIEAHLGRIVRFAHEVPFQDISEAFQKFLKHFDEDDTFDVPKGNPSPSNFMPRNIFPPVNTQDRELRKLFIHIFLRTGRVSHLHRIFALHTSFHHKFWTTYDYIMHQNGPIPVDWRSYIAILVSARYQCQYLVNVQEIEFIQNDGDKNWLKGIEYAPQKLQNLMELMQLMNHQPWLIKPEHIAALTKGSDSWSIGELVHAMVIICTFKGVAGIALGCGVTPEIDFLEDVNFEESDNSDEENDVPEEEPADGEEYTIETDKILEFLQEGVSNESSSQAKPESRESLFVQVENPETSNVSNEPLSFEEDFSRYRGKYLMQYSDFDVKSKDYSLYRVQDYNWKEHGFELFRRFLPGAAIPLDEEFDHIYNMTYYSFGKNAQQVNTERLRRSVWQYCQRVKGMFHDDYDYAEVNKFLNIPTKNFIKKIICYPETITQSDWNKIGYDFQQAEKVHVALLSVESAKQSELLYGLNAVMKYMNNR